jgi:hypothetical protein
MDSRNAVKAFVNSSLNPELALLKRHPMRLRRTGVIGGWAQDAVLAGVFDDAGGPPRHPREGKNWREVGFGQAKV